MKRINLSELNLLRSETEMLGNFTSVTGEYYVPQINKTAFYKMNGCMLGANEEEDLRELLASKVLDMVGFPHAEILLANDQEGKKGCLSVNILNQNEEFIEPGEVENQYQTATNLEEFIESDLQKISTIEGITSEDLRQRKEYLLKYVFASAIISNTDIKMDNMFIVKNQETGQFRNPEYYDMGVSFLDSENRRFFGQFSPEQIIDQLYEKYPSEIVPFGKQVEEKLKQEDLLNMLQGEEFEDLSVETKEEVEKQLSERMEIIHSQNSKEKNNFKYSINDIHETTKGADISLKDRIVGVLSKFKDKIVGERNE